MFNLSPSGFSFSFFEKLIIKLTNKFKRGGYDVSTPGSSSCYEPAAPCGTKPPGNATAFLTAGTTFTILFQQNLNHYNPGWPGFLDVAYGVGNNQTSDSQFTILQQIPDYWPHLQVRFTSISTTLKQLLIFNFYLKKVSTNKLFSIIYSTRH